MRGLPPPGLRVATVLGDLGFGATAGPGSWITRGRALLEASVSPGASGAQPSLVGTRFA